MEKKHIILVYANCIRYYSYIKNFKLVKTKVLTFRHHASSI